MVSMTLQDLMPHAAVKKNTNKKIDSGTVVPFILLPILLSICCISKIVTIIVMVVICMGVLYVYSRPRQKNRSQFFYSWTLSSALYMILIFEYEVLTLLEITQMEHFLLIILLACTSYSFYKVRAVADFEFSTGSSKGKTYSPILTADSHYCQICQLEVNERYFHSIWWGCCVFRPNYPYFLSGLVCSLFALVVGANLAITTVCQPYLFYGGILMPEDCSDVYFEFNSAICYVASIYALGYAAIVMLILLHQIFVILPKYFGPQWKKLFYVSTV